MDRGPGVRGLVITGAPDVAPPPTARRVGPIGAARALLLLGWAGVVVAVLVTGSLTTPLTELERGVRSGAVTSVEVTPGQDGPGAEGPGTQQVRWRDGWVERRTEVSTGTPGAGGRGEDLPFVGRDVVPQLQALAPGDLAVSTVEPPSSSSSAFGFQVQTALGLLAATWWICSITLLSAVTVLWLS